MLERRSDLRDAIARSAQLLERELPAFFVGRDMDRVPALVFARGNTEAERCRDGELRRALVLLEHVDGAIEVEPPIVDELEPAHTITLTQRGRDWLRPRQLELSALSLSALGPASAGAR